MNPFEFEKCRSYPQQELYDPARLSNHYDLLLNFRKAAELIIKNLPNRDLKEEALKDTPTRFAKMMLEQLQGEFMTNEEIARECTKLFEYEDVNSVQKSLVVVKDIPCFSHCEHHIALMYNMKVSIGYVPKGKILGLSKFARVVDLVSKRLQTQEKMAKEIIEILQMMIGADTPIYVHITAEHSCMTARGIQKPGTITKSVHTNERAKDIKEFLQLVEG